MPDDGIVIIDEPEKEQPQEQPQDVSDDNADIVNRIECPKTRGGNSIIVVKNDDEYGVNYFLELDCDKRRNVGRRTECTRATRRLRFRAAATMPGTRTNKSPWNTAPHTRITITAVLTVGISVRR